MTTPWLTDAEVDALCDGLITNGAKARYLRDLGLHVTRKPNGRCVVIRAHAEAVLSGLEEATAGAIPASQDMPPQPNRQGLILHFKRRQRSV